ncbi:imidazolonepropionase [Muricauda ruestringensis]|uniref:Imidazolonepropionase n=1 Tax=Flagellimonas aurea TaxID=2915619 RepID=A0ABS3G6Z2_9FLAO|nr:imidazolonepropionase [Allomuricauda aurea]MAO17679.1 imidazolonepropionase [Allomuricauda sp.]MBC72337.1 imidazolonepropionase [Allomuricauda sp.]MBO0354857.1 imidazolonepropionase [Allomuricauda aurea]
MSRPLLIGPFTQLLPMTGLPLKGVLKDEQLTIIENGGILVSEGKILKVGAFNELISDDVDIHHIEGNHVCLPGFVDSHTHICFGGTRARDYAYRNAGKTYLEIAKAGGGIWDTVTQTRKAPQEELVKGIIYRSKKHLKNGVTTIEVKSGYGLSVDEELKMLRAIKTANETSNATLVPTCLAAHMKPKDWHQDRDYLDVIINELFPIIKAENLAKRVDAFVEESAFSPKEINPYFQKAKEMGFDITVHADQFTTGGSQVAVDFDAVSADHLEASTEKEIQLLAKSNTIATALPGASIGLGCAYTPARKILDAGGALSIASDHNPGSAPMGDLLTQASILGTFEKLSNTEVLAGITFRAAATLRLTDRGKLEAGVQADFVIFPTDNYQEITYHQGQLKPSEVWKQGTSVH